MANTELMEEWEWPFPQERRLSIEPFEMVCRWPDGERHTLVWAVPYIATMGELLFFRPLEELANTKTSPTSWGCNYVSLLPAGTQVYGPDSDRLPPHCFLLSGGKAIAWKSKLTNQALHPARYFQMGAQSDSLTVLLGQNQGWLGTKHMTRLRFRCSLAAPPPQHQSSNATHSSAALLEWLEQQISLARETTSQQLREQLPWTVDNESINNESINNETENNEADPGAELRFAYRWNTLTPEIKADLLGASGLWLTQLFHLIARSESEFTSDLNWFPRLTQNDSMLRHSDPFLDLPGTPAMLQLQTRLRAWAELFKREFPPQNLPVAPLCLLDSHQDCFILNHSINGEDASAHEQLEAGLTLREWAQGKATPEEMAVLFPSLSAN